LTMAVSILGNRLARLTLQPECLAAHRVLVEKSTNAALPTISPIIREPEKCRDPGSQKPMAHGYGPPPLAFVFGWAGASDHNLSKYSGLYLKQGCTTAQLTIPTTLIWNDTEKIPEIMDSVLTELDSLGVRERPVVIHCLSDTGAMCYQGLDLATRSSRLDIRGVVWDSSPGPRPEITIPRVAALLAVNWFCVRKDGMDVPESFKSCYRLLMDRGWPNYLRRLKGLPVELSLIEGVWAGHFGRDHHLQYRQIPELFLYSNSDFYVGAKYIENEILARRKKDGADFSAKKFRGSAHVQHYRKHRKQYEEAVTEFLRKTFGWVEEVEEEEKEVVKVRKIRRDSGDLERGGQPRNIPALRGSFGV